jgi:uncharacterized protein (DUF2141 family)
MLFHRFNKSLNFRIVNNYKLFFHDINTNGRLDKNFLGIPKEGYGFSEKATAFMNAPGFEKAKFTLNRTYTSEIKMKY